MDENLKTDYMTYVQYDALKIHEWENKTQEDTWPNVYSASLGNRIIVVLFLFSFLYFLSVWK